MVLDEARLIFAPSHKCDDVDRDYASAQRCWQREQDGKMPWRIEIVQIVALAEHHNSLDL